ncbi:MAG: dockerin type I domain-containing protein [Patescibacteria group bacterium]
MYKNSDKRTANPPPGSPVSYTRSSNRGFISNFIDRVRGLFSKRNAAVVGLLFLAVGVGAGTIAVQRSTEYRQRAATTTTTVYFPYTQSSAHSIDLDSDGYDNSAEMIIGTDRFSPCSNNINHSSWPPDLNNDTKVDNTDVALLNSRDRSSFGDSNFNFRYDLNGDSKIDIQDSQILKSYLGRTCSATTQYNYTVINTPAEILPSIPSSQYNPEYAIVPVIFLPSDTNISINTYKSSIERNFNEVRAWYYKVFNKTFELEPAVLYVSKLSERTIYQKWKPDSHGLWIEGLREALNANGKDPCNSKRIYYLVTPLKTRGGAMGNDAFGCSNPLPGHSSIPSNMGKLIGNVIDSSWPESIKEPVNAEGGVAHELGHLFGFRCYYRGTERECGMLPHATSWGSIMSAWWDFRRGATFTQGEKDLLAKSPFLKSIAGVSIPTPPSNPTGLVSAPLKPYASTLSSPTQSCSGVTAQANLSWNWVSSATGYKIYQWDGTVNPGKWNLLTNITSGSTTNFLYAPLVQNSGYTLYVTAYNSAGESTPSNQIGFTAIKCSCAVGQRQCGQSCVSCGANQYPAACNGTSPICCPNNSSYCSYNGGSCIPACSGGQYLTCTPTTQGCTTPPYECFVSVWVYKDTNANGIFDGGTDFPIPNVPVVISRISLGGGITINKNTNAVGYVYLSEAGPTSGNYRYNYGLSTIPAGYTVTTTNAKNFVCNSSTSSDTLSVGLKPI